MTITAKQIEEFVGAHFALFEEFVIGRKIESAEDASVAAFDFIERNWPAWTADHYAECSTAARMFTERLMELK